MIKSNKQIVAISFCFLLSIFSVLLFAQDVQDADEDFEARIFEGSSGVEMPYRLFIPNDYTSTTSYPIVMYLHGGAGAGNDNLKQISGGNEKGTHIWITAENQLNNPCFVVAPQLLSFYRWNDPNSSNLSVYAQLAIELLETLLKDYKIDPDRVYLTGQSRGGYGTWDVIVKRPDLFAAAIPLCGGGDPGAVKNIRHLPIWAFHGAIDTTVPVEKSREMVEALKKIGGNIKYIEYPEVGHSVWHKAYLEPELIPWLFNQKRGK